MQTFARILPAVAIWMLCGTGGVFCAETKELTEIKEKISSLSVLNPEAPPSPWAHGDYTKLKLIIRSSKKIYNLDEPVRINVFVYNNSDSEVIVKRYSFSLGGCFTWKLFHSNYDEVDLVPKWKNIFQKWKEYCEKEGVDNSLVLKAEGWGSHIKLPPKQEQQVTWGDSLNEYADLSKPDTYELTCFLATACFGQYYEPPLQSNTLTFRVFEKGEKADVIEDGMNPPKGEEVFKQRKPPKSVFYVYEDEPRNPWIKTSDGETIVRPRKIIDVSPETYYHQRAKKQQ